jgi:hypothetical protein
MMFILLLVFCSVMVIRQFREKQRLQLQADARHIELREAFILLHSRQYKDEAKRLYNRLVENVAHLSNKNLLDDFQRTRMLVDPAGSSTNDLVWKYHWVVSNELENRAESTLVRAREIAEREGLPDR